MAFFLLLLWLAALVRLAVIVGRELDPHADGWAREGEEFRYTVARGKGSVVNSVLVGFRLPGEHRFAFRPEGVFDPVARWLGLVREFQSGDSTFDGRVYVDCEDPALHAALASNHDLRKAIFTLLPIGTGRRLRCANGWLWIHAPVGAVDKELSDERIAIDVVRGFQPALLTARDELRKFAGNTLRDVSRERRRLFACAVGVCLAAGAVGGLLFLFDERLQLVHDGIARAAGWWTAGVTAVFLVALFSGMRGLPRTHTLLMDLLLAVLPATWVAAWGVATHINQAFDVFPAARVTVTTNQVYANKSGKQKEYHLVVPQWPDGRAERDVEINSREYQKMVGSPCVDVVWRRGRLGDPWIQGFLSSGQTNCVEVE